MTIVEAQEIAELASRGKHRTWRDTDVLGKRAPMHLERIDSLIELHPEKIASGRLRDAMVLRKVLAHARQHLALMRLQRAPQALEMRLVGFLTQRERNTVLDRNARREGECDFAPLQLASEASSRDPAEPVAGCETFRERIAAQNESFRVECLRGFRAIVAEVVLATRLVFDQRDLVPREHFDELSLGIRGDERTGRVLKRGHEPAGFDVVLLDRGGERGDIDAVARMSRDLDR